MQAKSFSGNSVVVVIGVEPIECSFIRAVPSRLAKRHLLQTRIRSLQVTRESDSTEQVLETRSHPVRNLDLLRKFALIQ